MAGKINDIIIEGAQIFWRNFSGKPSDFNAAGDRNFCVFVDDIAPHLQADGWNVKFTKPKEDDDEPRAFLKVAVRYSNVPPHIYITTGKNTVELDETTVGEIDKCNITNVDLVITPYQYEVAGRTGVKAYVKKMYVTIEEDPMDVKYGGGIFASLSKPPVTDDDLPF